MTQISALTSILTNNSSANAETTLLPVKLSQAQGAALLTLANTSYLIKPPADLSRFLGQTLMLRVPLQGAAPSLTVATLVALAPSILLPFPGALAEQIRRLGIDTEKLLSLTRAPGGYLLGDARYTSGQLSFKGGYQLPLPALQQQQPEQMRARIIAQGSELKLMLDPIKAEMKVSLDAISGNTAPVTKNLVTAPITPEAILSTLQKKLTGQAVSQIVTANSTDNTTKPTMSATSPREPVAPNDIKAATNPISESKPTSPNALSDPGIAGKVTAGTLAEPKNQQTDLFGRKTAEVTDKVPGDKHLQIKAPNDQQTDSKDANLKKINAGPNVDPQFKAQVGTHLAAGKRLLMNLDKTGALPEVKLADTEQAPPATTPEAARRLLALLRPLPVTMFMGSMAIQEAIAAANGNQLLARQGAVADAVLHQPLAMVFQLLLGGAALKREHSLTPLMNQWLNIAAKATGINLQDAIALADDDTLDSLMQLAQVRREYAEASNPRDGWFFCLPYLLGEKQRQLEGHWQRQAGREQEDNAESWRLKLKFSLSDADLLVDAKRTPSALDVQLVCSQEKLNSRVGNYLPVLQTHLQSLGFGTTILSCRHDTVPGSLLPGKAFAVDLRA
ncbi:hypothetical protein [Shewanella litorisediminis]|uniref:Flagellar hook-length control protein-like C-terminal domain-containing protein n=1 Tax=Shewanella litorisediminis TaxID=1173586 RepID=A0ABX7FZR2_9GAMM|nr:hypothetical protein [Shewanella litorisediminis]MCL2919652.1 hypothetical protein [Shewanella litorisediminis]QRH00542.1 hypothetical protein JQC75_11670 [Shewanella litorisediminis]